MTSVKFLSFKERDFGNLAPCPNVDEMRHIAEVMKGDPTPRLKRHPGDLLDKELKVLADYRGSVLYIEGGVDIVRLSPKTINLWAYPPKKGDRETVIVGEWVAEIEYV